VRLGVNALEPAYYFNRTFGLTMLLRTGFSIPLVQTQERDLGANTMDWSFDLAISLGLVIDLI